jgi:hypothetical protein
MDYEARSERTTGVLKPKCESCDEEICFGEEYAEIDGVYYHIDCLRNLGVSEVLRLCGIDILEKWEEEIEESY